MQQFSLQIQGHFYVVEHVKFPVLLELLIEEDYLVTRS
jgi:hypothetical protein